MLHKLMLVYLIKKRERNMILEELILMVTGALIWVVSPKGLAQECLEVLLGCHPLWELGLILILNVILLKLHNNLCSLLLFISFFLVRFLLTPFYRPRVIGSLTASSNFNMRIVRLLIRII